MARDLGKITKSRLLAAMDFSEREMRKKCDQLTSRVEAAACKQGGLTVIGETIRVLSPHAELGIIISKKESCPKGFETVFVKTKKNPRVKVCRLAEDFRRLSPNQRPKGKPMRRKGKFGPGIEIEDIVPSKAHKTRKAERAVLKR